jgi:hypothetical protein
MPTFPISLPALPCPSRITEIKLNRDALTESPFTGTQQIQKLSYEAWRYVLEYPALTNAQAREWSAALASLRGRSGTVLFGAAIWGTPKGTWAGAPVVNGVGQSGTTLALSGFTAGATFKAGDRLQISSGEFARMHECLSDGTADGSGLATLDIWPGHRTAPGAIDPVTATNAKGVFRLAASEFSLNWDRPIYGFTLDLIEAVT